MHVCGKIDKTIRHEAANLLEHSNLDEPSFIKFTLALLEHPRAFITPHTFLEACTLFDKIDTKSFQDTFIMSVLMSKASILL